MEKSDRRAVREIYESCRTLSASTGRPFSPDGHLVGSLGEMLAADFLDPHTHASVERRARRWMLPASRDDVWCRSCRLTRRRPDESDPAAVEAWIIGEADKRRRRTVRLGASDAV